MEVGSLRPLLAPFCLVIDDGWKRFGERLGIGGGSPLFSEDGDDGWKRFDRFREGGGSPLLREDGDEDNVDVLLVLGFPLSEGVGRADLLGSSIKSSSLSSYFPGLGVVL